MFLPRAKWLGVIGVFFLLASCQKELDEGAFTTCAVEQINIFEGTAVNPAEAYWFEYDPQTWKATAIIINIAPANFYRRINITYSGNRVDLGITGFLELDAARRIAHLRIDNALPVADTGDYFYGYDAGGFLNDRLYDQGVWDMEHTRFENDGRSLTAMSIGYGNDPPVITGTFSYLQTPALQRDVIIPYGDIFPELLPFYPLIKYGRLGNLPLERTDLQVNLPNQPMINVVYHNSNYQLNTDGALSGFDNSITVPGLSPLRRRYLVTYTCN
ncbi:MAG TPA: hypothetical protein VK907_14835 [Phnomibacter sp.]|nr:hypothetical protein [Phnomibacter sp.]